MAEGIGAALDRIFARSEPKVRDIVDRLIARACEWPGVAVDPKRTCIHLNRRVAFAGLHPRKSALLVNLRTIAPIPSPRIRKVERASANRCHNELLVESMDELDDELIGWVAEAHSLAR
jgi:hypothetical protein